jgi:hypothetical protein
MKGLSFKTEFAGPVAAAVGAASAPSTAPTVTPEPGVQYFIFGYGSLLERFSRMKTDCGVVGISEFMLGSLFQQDGLVAPYGPESDVNCTTARDAVIPARISGMQCLCVMRSRSPVYYVI